GGRPPARPAFYRLRGRKVGRESKRVPFAKTAKDEAPPLILLKGRPTHRSLAGKKRNSWTFCPREPMRKKESSLIPPRRYLGCEPDLLPLQLQPCCWSRWR